MQWQNNVHDQSVVSLVISDYIFLHILGLCSLWMQWQNNIDDHNVVSLYIFGLCYLWMQWLYNVYTRPECCKSGYFRTTFSCTFSDYIFLYIFGLHFPGHFRTLFIMNAVTKQDTRPECCKSVHFRTSFLMWKKITCKKNI